MTKMNMPEITVVRFDESDVIVASSSGLNVLHVSGFTKTDGINNGSMTFNNSSVSYVDGQSGTPTDFINVIKNAGCGTHMDSITYADDYTGGRIHDIEDLFEADWGSGNNYAFAADGDYTWNGSTWQ